MIAWLIVVAPLLLVAWFLCKAARLGDDQQSLSHAECVTRTQPHGNCEVVRFPRERTRTRGDA